MQTFVPYPDIHQSALVLDRQRLGKQRVETFQLLRAISDASLGWQKHPAAKMWRGYENGLVAYGVAICSEWISRGYKDTCLEKIQAFGKADEEALPPWWGDELVHSSHRANLLRKLPEHYGRFGWKENPDMPYFWPVR